MEKRYERNMERNNRKIRNYVCCLLICICAYVHCITANANKQEPDLFKVRVTCYTAPQGSVTASGGKVHEGICAGKKEWLGCVAVLYDKDLQIIGYYEFTDTGAGIDTDGDGIGDSIKNGTSIDIYRDTLGRCYEWISEYGDYLYIQVIKAEG